MVQVSLLTDSDIEYLCGLISAKEIKRFFRKNPNLYAQIKPGFRPTSLSDNDAISLVCKNHAKPFITDFIESFIEVRMEEMQEYRQSLIENGVSPDKALLKTLPDSVFCDNIDLFFKVSDEQYSDEYISLVKAALQLITESKRTVSATYEQENEVQVREKKDISVLDERIKEQTGTIEQLHHDLDVERDSHAQSDVKHAEEKSALQKEIQNVGKALNDAQAQLTQMNCKLEHYHKLEVFEDSSTGKEYHKEFEYTSICQVYQDYTGQPWLKRLADICDGRICRFNQVEDAPIYFGNRDRLFWKDGPSSDGFVGVWDWNAVPNQNDPNTDYVTTAYNSQISAVEIRELTDCVKYNDIIELLQKGIPGNEISSKMLISLPCTDGAYSSILCYSRDFDVANGVGKLRASVFTLPIFSIPAENTISFDNKLFCQNINLGLPQDLIRVKDPVAAVKDIIISRSTITQLKLQGLSKKEAQHCRDYLTSIATDDLYDEIADAYGCSQEDAKKYVAEFIELADSYISGNDIDGAILSAVVARNTELVLRCKEMLSEEWALENADQISVARKKLDEAEVAAKNQNEAVNKLKSQYNDLQHQLKTVQAEIDSKEALAYEVEEKVANRIVSAKKNAADFICEMAFSMPCKPSPVNQDNPFNDNGTEPSGSHRALTAFVRKSYADTVLKKITDIESFEEKLADNLGNVGYSDIRSVQLAQMISFCIGQQLPIVCSFNTEKIADCIAAMFGIEGVSVVNMPIGEFYPSEIHDILSQNAHKVLLITGALDTFLANAFNSILQFVDNPEQLIFLFSSEGVSPEALPDPVWNRAMYVDGDMGIDHLPKGKLAVFHSEINFKPDIPAQLLKQKKKQLRPFSSLISSMALLNYACFMSVVNGDIKSEYMILTQIILRAKAIGKTEKLLESFESTGINATDKELAIYL